METKSGIPVVIKEWNKSFFFGIVKIDYHVEDRRPDVEEYEHGKYKHFLVVRIARKEYRWTFRTNYEYEDMPYTD